MSNLEEKSNSEKNSTITTESLANRKSTLLYDPDDSINDEDQDAFVDNESESEQEPKVKKGRGKQKLYTKVITFPDYPTTEKHIATNYTNYRKRYEKPGIINGI